MPEGSEHLARLARSRKASAMARATAALRRMEREGEPISFVAVAKAASVSRNWLYHHPELRAEIERLRASQPRARRVPTAQRASIESLRHRIEALREEAARLRRQNQLLRDQLARKLGAERQSALGGGHLQ
jgi:TolA-binding protein